MGTSLLLFLGALLCSLSAGLAWETFDSPLPSEMLMPVHLGKGLRRERRQAIEKTQPLRILPVYEDNVDASLGEKAALVRGTIIPKLLDFLQQSLMVAPLPGPILINNQCSTTAILVDTATGGIMCGAQCVPTMCGLFQVPPEHLKQCRECNAATTMINPNNCVTGTPAQDGEGVVGYDFILYITAIQAQQCGDPTASAQTVAFASSCQNEVTQDRPVAGSINFCPSGILSRDPDFAFAVSKHEVLHAIGFSSTSFALWRDPATNEPRTVRDDRSGLPSVVNGRFVISDSTVDTTVYTDWFTRSGTISHTVTRLVTPAVRDEARRHFGCSSLAGVELENQGGGGTSLEHWEKRVLGNEAMTGQLTFNPVFSNFTFAALEDSGWYSVNYSLADELVWGRGAGCRFAEGSCGEWIDRQNSMNLSPAPFCDVPQVATPTLLSCTADREAVSRCNRVQFNGLPGEFQYFQDPASGGSVTVADFCPIQDVFTISTAGVLRGTTCSIASNSPSSNQLLEDYGTESRCLNHGRQWTINGQDTSKYGGGCYQYSCDTDLVRITIADEVFTCSCSQAGEEMMVDLQVGNNRHQGSIICPSCTSICHVRSNSVTQSIAFSGGGDGGGNGGGGGGGGNSASVLQATYLPLITTLLLSLAIQQFYN